VYNKDKSNYLIKKQLMNFLRKIISESISNVFEVADKSQKEIAVNKLASILNSLEFKDDVLRAGGDIYAVGGIVRDAIMGKQSDDLDIVVRGVPYDELFAILSKYGKPTDTSTEKEDGKDFGATKFKSRNEAFNKMLIDNGIRLDIDVMLPRKDAKDPNAKGHKGIQSDVNPNYTIYDDLKRRDITINAIALDLNGNIISMGSGEEDIEKGVIKAVSDDAFVEDPLRMLRAIRFAARFNYKIDDTTLNLIRDNAYLLADKAELPRERFLMEFEKMIGKTDLGRAVELLVDFGLYKAIFGVDSKIYDYRVFDKAKNVAEFCYLLFQNEPVGNILPLSTKNITNSNYDIAYLEALLKYKMEVGGLNFTQKINKLAEIYNKSADFLLISSFVSPEDKKVAEDFKNGLLPKGEHDVNLKGEEFKNFIVNTIKNETGQFNPKEDGRKMGVAKNLTLQAIYKKEINNTPDAIKNFLLNNLDLWMV
jgi:tRNA nucleotidyltransferase/poly(A) polymerase